MFVNVANLFCRELQQTDCICYLCFTTSNDSHFGFNFPMNGQLQSHRFNQRRQKDQPPPILHQKEAVFFSLTRLLTRSGTLVRYCTYHTQKEGCITMGTTFKAVCDLLPELLLSGKSRTCGMLKRTIFPVSVVLRSIYSSRFIKS